MGRKRKGATDVSETPANYSNKSFTGDMKTNMTYLSEKASQKSRVQIGAADYGSVTEDVLSGTLRSEQICRQMHEIYFKLQNSNTKTPPLNPSASSEKFACKKVLFQSSDNPRTDHKETTNAANVPEIILSSDDSDKSDHERVEDEASTNSMGKTPATVVSDSMHRDSELTEVEKSQGECAKVKILSEIDSQSKLSDLALYAEQTVIALEKDSSGGVVGFRGETDAKVIHSGKEPIYLDITKTDLQGAATQIVKKTVETEGIKVSPDDFDENFIVVDDPGQEEQYIKWDSDESDSDSDEEDDQFSTMWNDMNMVISRESKQMLSQENDADLGDTAACDHSYYKQEDIGLFCTKCGFVKTVIEEIADDLYKKTRKVSKNHRKYARKRSPRTVFEFEEKLDSVLDIKQPDSENIMEELDLHPRFEKVLKAHQKEAFEFLKINLIQKNCGCILAHAPGTGKTCTVISFIQSFLAKYQNERPMIVAPKSILITWNTEFKKWLVEKIPLYNLSDVQNHAEPLRKNQLDTLIKWKQEKSVLMLSYSLFASIVCDDSDNHDAKQCQNILLTEPGLLILDEGHFPRNKETKSLLSLSQIKTRKRVLLSGTLFQNNFQELYNILNLARPNFHELAQVQKISETLIENSYYTERCPRLHRKNGDSGGMEVIFSDVIDSLLEGSERDREIASTALRKMMPMFVHYYKGEVLQDLPGFADYTVKLKLTARQSELLKEIDKNTDRMIREKSSALVSIHPDLYEANSNHSKLLDAKPVDGVKIKFVLAMYNFCLSSGEKLIVFCQYIKPLAFLERVLPVAKHRSKFLRLDGKASLEQRTEIINEFNNGKETTVLLASIRACGEGICLTGASRVIIMDVPWNPSVTIQAIRRAYRIGQKRKVFAYRLVAGEVDEEISRRALVKEQKSKMLFTGENYDSNVALLSEVKLDECEDIFFHGASSWTDDIAGLFEHAGI